MATESATAHSSSGATATAPVIEARAMAKHVRMSPQKVRLVIDLIRGERAESALQILKYAQKRASRDVEKVLRSAIANAERKAEDAGATLDVDQLFVSNCFVNEGSRWKRLRPAPMGRAFRYQRRTSHIIVGVAEHHLAARDRAVEAAAEKESQKGVRGAVKKAREALVGQKKNTRRPKKEK
jgi:large subunit ribosomal protein L22